MFNNPGGKIKDIVSIVCVIMLVLSIIYGIGFLVDEQIVLGLTILIGGPFVTWLSTIALYAFGQLVENSDKIVSDMNTLKLYEEYKHKRNAIPKEIIDDYFEFKAKKAAQAQNTNKDTKQ